MRIIRKNEYPFLLRQMDRPPRKMYLEGELPRDDQNYRFLCVVGSRTHSSYGDDACRDIILGMSGYPVVIVSGMAIGIDSIAHEAALEAGLKTIAFPGSGLDKSVLYPRSRHDLAKRILEAGGALLSPFKPDQGADIWTFPVRNQLMAGISQAVLVVEARRSSGTMITVDAAADMGRDMLVVPGSIFSDLSEGPNKMLREGGIAVTCAEDVLESLGFKLPERGASSDELEEVAKTLDLFLNEKEVSLIKSIRSPKNRDELMKELGLGISELNVLLMGLELRGLVEDHDGYIVNIRRL